MQNGIQTILGKAERSCSVQAGKGNVMDDSIKRYVEGQAKQEVEAEWVRLGEVAFDFDRRRLSVILQQSCDSTADSLLICKVFSSPGHAGCCFFRPARMLSNW